MDAGPCMAGTLSRHAPAAHLRLVAAPRWPQPLPPRDLPPLRLRAVLEGVGGEVAPGCAAAAPAPMYTPLPALVGRRLFLADDDLHRGGRGLGLLLLAFAVFGLYL